MTDRRLEKKADTDEEDGEEDGSRGRELRDENEMTEEMK